MSDDKALTIPVRFSNNKIFYLNSNEQIKIKDGTLGELTIPGDAIIR